MEAKQIYIFLHILPAAVLRTKSYRRNKGFFSFLSDAFFAALMRGFFSVSIVLHPHLCLLPLCAVLLYAYSNSHGFFFHGRVFA